MNIADPKALGFIGTGAIAESVITGLIRHAGFDGEVFISERTAARSQRLADQFANVGIETDNQSIVDGSQWVFLSVLPEHARDVLRELDFRSDQTLISLVAALTIEEIVELVTPVTRAHRIIPLPPIVHGVGPLPIYPPNPEIASVFNRCGHAIEIENEDHFSAFSAASSVMAAHHRLTATIAAWIENHGLPPEMAADYASHMVHSLAEMETRCSAEELNSLAHDCLTEGGLNEQVLAELHKAGWFEKLTRRLDRIAERLDAGKLLS
ncbi:MAG: NAD(P)-binding domain-containing protein [Pirellulaceae bacterium]